MDTEEKVPQEGQPVAPQAPKRKQMCGYPGVCLAGDFFDFYFFIPFGRRGGNLHGAHLAGE